jgi:hypothetical protein
MELGIVFGFAFWGYDAGKTASIKILLAIGAPVLVFSFWGLVDGKARYAYQEFRPERLRRLFVQLASPPSMSYTTAFPHIR